MSYRINEILEEAAVEIELRIQKIKDVENDGIKSGPFLVMSAGVIDTLEGTVQQIRDEKSEDEDSEEED